MSKILMQVGNDPTMWEVDSEFVDAMEFAAIPEMEITFRYVSSTPDIIRRECMRAIEYLRDETTQLNFELLDAEDRKAHQYRIANIKRRILDATNRMNHIEQFIEGIDAKFKQCVQ